MANFVLNMDELQQGPIRIDLRRVLDERLGRRRVLVPGWLCRRLERLVCQDGLNKLLSDNWPARGADFCRGVLRDLCVSVRLRRASHMPTPSDCRVIFVCNHPLGGLDGMALEALLSDRLSRPVQVVVNDLLMAVEPLRDVFLPINKHGVQSRNASRAIDEAMAGDGPVLMFPAGLVSRLGADGRVADLAWHKMFVNKAVEHRRDVVPLHFDGCNSMSFYRAARRRVRLGLKFNFEMLLLPREVFAGSGRTYTVTCGDRIPWSSLRAGRDAEAQAAAVRDTVYSLMNITSDDE